MQAANEGKGYVSHVLVDGLLTYCCPRIKGHNPDSHLIASRIGGLWVIT